MKARIAIVGPIGIDPFDLESTPVTMLSVARQVESAKDASELVVFINSPGGYIEEADAIFNYLKEQGKKITTVAFGTCASIATKLFLLGETRMIQEGCFFMIHNPWNTASGDADKMAEISKDLKNTENKMAKEYASLTGTSESAIKELMKQETSFTAQEAVDLGFATSIYTPVAEGALAIFKKKPMKVKNKSLLEKIKALVSGAKGLTINAASGPEGSGLTLEFADLSDDAAPMEGDSATVDGNPAEGRFVLEDGSAINFERGAVTSIEEASTEDEEEITEEELQAMVSQVEEMTAENQTLREESEAKDTQIEELTAEVGRLKALAGKAEKGTPKQRGSASIKDEDNKPKSRSLFKKEA